MKIKVKLKWTKQNIDTQVRELIVKHRVSPVAWWLMSSFSYYVLNKTIVSDETFDWIGRYIHDNWESIKHPNKRLIRRNGTFSGYYVRSYPTRCKVATWRILESLEETVCQKKLKIKKRSILCK